MIVTCKLFLNVTTTKAYVESENYRKNMPHLGGDRNFSWNDSYGWESRFIECEIVAISKIVESTSFTLRLIVKDYNTNVVIKFVGRIDKDRDNLRDFLRNIKFA